MQDKQQPPFLQLIEEIDLFFIKWIPDNQNKAADALAREAILKNKKQNN